MATRRTVTKRETKITSRISDTDDAPPVKKAGGLTMIDGLAIVTTLLMIGAILLVDYNLGAMGEGMFFKK